MSEFPGNIESAPDIAPLQHGDREAQSRLARQKRQQKQMNERVWGGLLAVGFLIFLLGLWFLRG